VNVKSKGRQLLSLAWRRPLEACERVATFLAAATDLPCGRAPEYQAATWAGTVSRLDTAFSGRFSAFLCESELQEIEHSVNSELSIISRDGPFGSFHNADFALARVCYAVCRLVQPRVIVETGVCYGVTSAFLLAALAKNAVGELHSIDLPPLSPNGDAFVGRLVPADLRRRWQLHRGTSKSLLPKLLKELGTLDLFIHDSLHTYRNMRRELHDVTPFLSRNSALVADDIEGHSAFSEFLSHTSPRLSAVVQENSKAGLFGIALLGSS
jgi:hypothetical protein